MFAPSHPAPASPSPDPTPAACHRYHNHNGTLSVERVPFKTPLVDAFLAAGEYQGYSVVDYNNPDENSQGFSRLQANMHAGRRINGANAFLRPIR